MKGTYSLIFRLNLKGIVVFVDLVVSILKTLYVFLQLNAQVTFVNKPRLKIVSFQDYEH